MQCTDPDAFDAKMRDMVRKDVSSPEIGTIILDTITKKSKRVRPSRKRRTQLENSAWE